MPNAQNIDSSNLIFDGYSGIGRIYSTSTVESLSNHSSTIIKSYNYVPKKFLLHHVNDEEKLYLGVELEIDSGGENEDNARYVCDVMNTNNENIYCKHDGSLINGFEIVSHPCTLDYHKTLKYEEIFEWLVKQKYRSHDTSTCGMHVHINRDYFGVDKLTQDLCIGKLLYLCEKHWEMVELIARRTSNRYARRFLLEENETIIDLYAKSQSSDKYGAINLKHKDTIEMRIFKGTLNYNTFIRTLEFVSVFAKIAKDTDIYDIQFVTWDKIKNNFSNELNNYITLREDVKAEGIRKKSKHPDFPSSGNFYVTSADAISRNNTIFSESYIGAMNQFAERCFVSMDSLQLETMRNGLEINEISEEEQIKREIANLRSQVRRSRNGLEEINLNRKIAQLENKLRRLRRNNQVTITCKN